MALYFITLSNCFGRFSLNGCIVNLSFVEFRSQGHIPARMKMFCTCSGLNNSEYKCSNNDGTSSFSIVLQFFCVRYFMTIRFHDCFNELKLKEVIVCLDLSKLSTNREISFSKEETYQVVTSML